MNERIADIAALEALYGVPSPMALKKVAPRLTPEYRRWIETARFCLVATVGPEGTDISPRGDDGPVVRIAGPDRLEMPDWRGNNRLDTLRNIVRDPRVSLLFMVPGSNNVVRVNGRAHVTADETLRHKLAHNGHLPQTVVVIGITEVYFQCGRAILRSGLWNRDDSEGLPSAGEMIASEDHDSFDPVDYDQSWSARAKDTLWS
ncbi:pyridoxamine 5'-phosphate oxidase family protein [Palleronia caenipelagi]|uniref:Pyridoxamine 5'-phosphate oxidase family protein n=1 Tax=Palleronia caenipelagi TaxID=2489174 RepID=A0A547Q2X4_9RHOB|nr:pyridoxamine 5'-phosphate oxidase family protein [Palleronia caenipelagi]TRD20720.1 pyridoxamine 5'-phosphate oxidase family protein [Palleronia caenipelagi]